MDAFLAGGARFIQLRAKHAPSGELLSLAQLVVERARKAGAVVIVNDRADIAKLSGADGVHVGQHDLEPALVRRVLGGAAVVGLSTHTIDQVRQASRLAVDYIAVGPIFGSSSKETGYSAVGTALVSQARAQLAEAGLSTPIVAIGGITLETAPAVLQAGASAVAVIADLLSTGDPQTRIREYRACLSSDSARM